MWEYLIYEQFIAHFIACSAWHEFCSTFYINCVKLKEFGISFSVSKVYLKSKLIFGFN